MRIDIVTIFPEFFDVLDISLLGKARTNGIIDLGVHNLRDFAHDRHRTVDDTPAGGGAGMVMKPEPWGEALDSVLDSGSSSDPLIIFPSPAGVRFDQACSQMAAWRDGPLGAVTVSINVSAWQLADPFFVALVQQTLACHGLQPRQLELELTERVLTDGGIYYDATGECLKRFHVRDGLGMRLLEENGVRVAVLSGRDSPTLRKRVADLGITLYQFGVKDKHAACRELMEQAGTGVNETVCIGDDSIDLPAFAACGLSYAVADAPVYVQARASAVLVKEGGKGAFRELADAILVAQGKEHVFGSAEGFSTVMGRVVQ